MTYALLMLESNPFLRNNHIIILIRSLNSLSFAQLSKKPSLSNHPNRQDLGEKTDFLTRIGRRERNFDCKL